MVQGAEEVAKAFGYSPEATSFSLRYDIVNEHEDDCDTLLFEDVPIHGKGINGRFNDDIVTYNGFHYREQGPGNRYYIDLLHNKPREVRHVGLAAITDNLGNQYGFTTDGSWGYSEEDNTYYENFKVKALDPNARSISFKYLFARTLLAFEFQDLPLPS